MVFEHTQGSVEEKMAQQKQRGTGSESDSGDRRPIERALRHPLRVQILAACHQRDVTPKEFAEERGIHVSNVGYHFRALQKEGYIQVVREERARGSRRHFYRTKRRGFLSDSEFAQAGSKAQREASDAVLQDFIVRCVEAMKAGTFDARSDSHFTWSALELDEQGWNELTAELGRIFKRSFEIEAEARDRLREGNERPIQVTLGLAGFESPAEDAAGLEGA